ncbi:hypothetical protein [Sulfurimonas sp.]|uniref:hypothetical protein n=1 Tax=Sulfurimonas sp. TaxID=2022749 RepID=UPI002619DB63|nr:hypothetical protein [Sulfurimonas sp.]MCW8895024.1 hypothetical protein [Sulfurimonas sp.]
MQNIHKTLESIIIEIKLIQLQLHLAKKSAKKIYTLQSTPSKVQLHIEHSLHSLNHLIAHIDDLKIDAELKHSARHRTKEIQ